MKKSILLISIVLLCYCAAHAQSTVGIPSIKNYTHNDYNAATEIWDAKQDKNGILYFANNDGLLTFDGSYWKTYPLPNKTAIKSVAVDASGRIFVGGQDEIGYFFPNDAGILKFHSIKTLLPIKARQFADIWSIVLFNNEVFFRTIECIFEYDNRQMKTFDAPGGWRMLRAAGTQLFAEDKDMGLLVFKDHQWHSAAKTATLDLHVTAVMDYAKDTLLVTTLKKGIYLFTNSILIKKPTAIDGVLVNDLISVTKKLDNDKYAIGTTANGLFIIDKAGRLTDHFSTNEGVQSNNILSLLLDRDKNLWLGQENGLDFINYNTSVKHIYPVAKNQIKSNSARVFDNKLFIGTSNGLYSLPLTEQQKDISKIKGSFTEVNNTKGPVWALNEINHKLLAGHQDGGFVINNNLATPITNRQGAWMFVAMPGSDDVIAGTYTGLQLIKNTSGSFTDIGKVDGIYESMSHLTVDSNKTIWASHPYRGIFKIQLTANHKKIAKSQQYTEKNGLPSVLNNHVYFIKNKILVSTEKGVYEYYGSTDTFVPSTFFEPIFGDSNVEFLTEDSSGNIWFISDQRVGVVDFSKRSAGKSYNVIYLPELANQTVKGSAFIYPYNAENIFIGSNNGVFHLNYRQYVQTENKLNVLLTSVKAIAEKDSLIFGGYFTKTDQVTSLSKHWNSFHFEYSSTLFAQKSNEEFSYKLEGFDKEWSKWSVKTEKDYTNLSYGKYTFSVKARNNLGNASQPVNYTFVVEPAWYQTVWAYLIYFLIITYLVYFALKEQRKRFYLHQKKYEEEQRRLSYLHTLELDRNEKEIIALKNENLETELNYKNKELATTTMHLVDRGRLLLTIKEELMSLIKKLNIPDASYQFRGVFKLLSDTDNNDDDWDHFAIYFDQVHNDFLTTMKAKFPCLTSTDLKLCAYLRLNLSSKEIAQLLNISLKGVEISRYRVRKKLQLSKEVNLYDFLIEATKA